MTARPNMAAVDAHNNGDCWPPSCPVCELEDREEPDHRGESDE